MKSGDSLLARERTRELLFDLLLIEIEYIDNFYYMVGRKTLYEMN